MLSVAVDACALHMLSCVHGCGRAACMCVCTGRQAGTLYRARMLLCAHAAVCACFRACLHAYFARQGKSCNTFECPAPCLVAAWTSWSACSISCAATGSSSRSRTVVSAPVSGGSACPALDGQRSCGSPAPCPAGTHASLHVCPIGPLAQPVRCTHERTCHSRAEACTHERTYVGMQARVRACVRAQTAS